MTSPPRAMSNQCWNNIVFLNAEIYTVEQRRINVVYFNVDINNVRQRQNNVVIFNVKFYKVDQRRNNVVNMTINKKVFFEFKKKKIKLSMSNSRFSLFFQNTVGFMVLFLILREIWRRTLQRSKNSHGIEKTLHYKNYI